MKLPIKAQKIYDKVYEKAISEGLNASKSLQLALSAVKKAYSVHASSWIVRGGFITTKEIILRNFDSDGDFFFEGYATSFEPDDGDLSGANGGESVRITPEVGVEIAKLLEELGIGGGIEHDTNPASRTFDKDADQVFKVVKATKDDYGVKVLAKLNKESKRFELARDQIKRGILPGLSLELIPAQAGFKYETLPNGRVVKNLLRFDRLDGLSLARKSLDNRARVKSYYETRRKDKSRRSDSINAS